MEIYSLFLLVFLGIIVFIVVKGIFIVRQQECIVVERLGSFRGVLESGLHILIPMIDQTRNILWSRNGVIIPTDRIDLREVVLDIPEQRVITKDNVGLVVDAIIYVQITDVKRAAYEIQSVPLATAQLTQTTLRNLIGEMELDQTLSSRDAINHRLKLVLDEATDKWGLKVNRVELRNITPPADIQMAMEKQMQAERERRASVLTAEGSKQSRVLEAEGDKQARIERSQGEQQEKINQALGDRDAIIARAQGQANSIEVVRNAFGSAEVAANYLIAMEYLKRFGEFTLKPSDKVFLPYEATGVLSSLGAMKEILGASGKK